MVLVFFIIFLTYSFLLFHLSQFQSFRINVLKPPYILRHYFLKQMFLIIIKTGFFSFHNIFVLIYIIHKMLALLKNHLMDNLKSYLKDSFFKKHYRLLLKIDTYIFPNI